MSAWNVANNWQWARWTWNIARNMRITGPTAAELASLRTFLKFIWNPVARTGTRPWLDDAFNSKAVAASGGKNYKCDIDSEPDHVLVECLNVVGRDFKKSPLTSAEEAMASALFSATGNRRYGTGPYFGGVAGSQYAGA